MARKFFVPPTLVQDFDNFLNTELPGANISFEILHDWYDQFEEGYEPHYERGEMYPDSTKSRYVNTDNNLNVRFGYNACVNSGDYVIGDGVIYLLDWQVAPQPNNRATRAVRCNTKLTIKRYQQEVTDRYAMVIEQEGFKDIVTNIPANGYRYEGRPQFSAINFTPGISANALTIVSVQFNEKTKHIHVDDEFVWGDDTYTIIDIDWMGVNIDEERGVLRLQARKKAGGQVDI